MPALFSAQSEPAARGGVLPGGLPAQLEAMAAASAVEVALAVAEVVSAGAAHPAAGN